MISSFLHKLAIVAAFVCATAARGSFGAAPAPWDRGDLYKLTSTNVPPKPTGPAVESREALDELMGDAPTSLATVVLGAAQALYEITQDDATNLTADAATAEHEVGVRMQLRDADRLTQEGHIDEAIAVLVKMLNQPMPPVRRGKINNRIAYFFFRQQRYQEALPYIREAMRANPMDPVSTCNLAAVLLSMGDIKEADFLLRSINLADVRDPKLLFSILFNRACAASLQKNSKDALDALLKAAQSDPTSALASLGDPQLDSVRGSIEFFDLKARLETVIAPSGVTADGGAARGATPQ